MKGEIYISEKLPHQKVGVEKKYHSYIEMCGKWEPDFLRFIEKADLCDISICSGDWGDFSFLELIPKENLFSLSINVHNADSLVAISELEQLEELIVTITGNIKEKTFSFKRLQSLKKFVATEFEFYDEDLFSCQHLNHVSLYNSYRWDDVRALSNAEKLRKLNLNGGKLKSLEEISAMAVLEDFTVNRCQINSLNGIEGLKNLKEFGAYDLRKLDDISVVAEMHNLVGLSFQACNKVEDFAVIGEIDNLRDLGIENKKIPTIGFLEYLGKLEYLALADTNILDGDLSVLYRLASLKRASFKNKKHYNAKNTEFSEEAILERKKTMGKAR